MDFFIVFFIAVIFSSASKVFQENTVHKYGVEIHGAIKFLQMSLLMMFFTFLTNTFKVIPLELKFNLELNSNAVIFIFIITILTIISTYLFNKLLEHEEIYSLGLLMKLTILIVLFIDIATGTLVFKWSLILYVIIFLIGILIMFDVHLLKGHHIKNDLKKAEFILPIFLILIIRPYFKRFAINSNYFNVETLLIIQNLAISLLFFVKYKPKISFNIFKEYLLQSFVCIISLFAFNLLIANYGVFYFNLSKGLTLIFIALLSRAFLHTRITKRKYLGMSIAVLGFILLSINI